MSPKPGFWFYDGQRALRVYIVLAVFGLGIAHSKLEPLTWDDILEIYKSYRIQIFLVLGALAALIYFVRRLLGRWEHEIYGSGQSSVTSREPRAKDYTTRDEFEDALRDYCEKMGYLPGWVYYRMKETWPEQ